MITLDQPHFFPWTSLSSNRYGAQAVSRLQWHRERTEWQFRDERGQAHKI